MQKTMQEYLDRALAAEESGDIRGAENIYLQMIKINPSDSFAYNNLGTLRARAGNYEGAHVALQRAVENNPESINAQFNLARLHNLMRNYAAAEVHFRKSIELAPDDVEIRQDFFVMLTPEPNEFFTVGYVLENQVDYTGAAAVYRAAVTALPEDPSCWYMLGMTHFAKKEYEAAQAAFEEAIDIDESFGLAYMFLANCFSAMGNREEGLKLAHFVSAHFMKATRQ